MSGWLGFAVQGKGACARFALRHALLCLGVPTTERAITRGMRRGRLRTRLFGSDEVAILRGVRRLGARPEELRARTGAEARRGIDRALREGAPCILCVTSASGDGWGHWALLAGRVGERYLWIDSADDRVVGTWTWTAIARWMRCEGEAEPFYAIAVRPRTSVARARSLTPRAAAALPALRDERQRDGWGVRLAALRRIFRAAHGVPARRVLADLRGGDVRELRALAAVADAHDLRAAPGDVDRARAAAAALVGGLSRPINGRSRPG